jgi:RHS repeat-associated protein
LSAKDNRFFVFDDRGRLLAITDPSGQPLQLFSHDAIGLMSVHKPQNSALSTQNYLFDGLGSVVALTDIRGNKTRDYAYDEWGNELWPGGDGENPYRFTGRWGGFTEDATGRVLNWNRVYSPLRSIWLQRDPAGIQGGSNLLRYADNNPVLLVDPLGWVPKSATPTLPPTRTATPPIDNPCLGGLVTCVQRSALTGFDTHQEIMLEAAAWLIQKKLDDLVTGACPILSPVYVVKDVVEAMGLSAEAASVLFSCVECARRDPRATPTPTPSPESRPTPNPGPVPKPGSNK